MSPAITEGVMQSPGGGGWLVTKTNSTALLLKGQELKLDQLLHRSAMRVINLSYHAAVRTALSRSRFHHSKLELQMNLIEFQGKGEHTGPPRGFEKAIFFSPRNSLLSRVSVSVRLLIQWFFFVVGAIN